MVNGWSGWTIPFDYNQEGNNIPDGIAMAEALAKSSLIPGALVHSLAACIYHYVHRGRPC